MKPIILANGKEIEIFLECDIDPIILDQGEEYASRVPMCDNNIPE